MSLIPGLELSSIDDSAGEGIKIPSFTGEIVVRESHRYGHCRKIDDFEKMGKVAEGSFGTTYRCRDKRYGKICDLLKFNIPADKKSGKEEIPLAETRYPKEGVPLAVLRQISILHLLKNDNIIGLHGTAVGKNLENNYMIFDCLQFSLSNLINKKNNKIYEESVVKGIMKQLFLGIDSMHKMSIIHRGINSGNIKFSAQGVLKIAGFESAQFYVKNAVMSPDVNELRYRAPELVLQSKTYTPAVDMWAAGCVLAELVFKKPLFNGNTDIDILKSMMVILGEPSESIWPGYTELFSKWNEGGYNIKVDKGFRKLDEMFPETTPATKEMINYLLLYFPNVRLTSDQCLKSMYFQENPQACKNLEFILQKNVGSGSGTAPMDVV